MCRIPEMIIMNVKLICIPCHSSLVNPNIDQYDQWAILPGGAINKMIPEIAIIIDDRVK